MLHTICAFANDFRQDTLQVTHQATLHDKYLKNQDDSRHIAQTTDHVTDQVTDHVEQLVVALTAEMSRAELQTALQLRHRRHFAAVYLRPSLEAGLIEMTLPDKPRSQNQRYRRTARGKALAEHVTGKNAPA